MKKFPIRLLLLTLLIGSLIAYYNHVNRFFVYQGQTMGTTFKVVCKLRFGTSQKQVTNQVDDLLNQAIQLFSTYESESVIQQFNRYRLDKEFYVSENFLNVVNSSYQLFERSNGLFDPTVQPLVRLWNITSDQFVVPDLSEIQSKQAIVGFHKIKVTQNAMTKTNPNIELDFSAIAKGFVVDQIADMLNAMKLIDFFVEVGGEVRSKGVNQNGFLWRVGIFEPTDDVLSFQAPWDVVQLKNQSMATSGDYRQSQTVKGKKYTHIINPKTGYPIQSSVRSVSVIADSCMVADGLATTLMMMSPEEGIEFVTQYYPSVNVLILFESPEGALESLSTPGFGKVSL